VRLVFLVFVLQEAEGCRLSKFTLAAVHNDRENGQEKGKGKSKKRTEMQTRYACGVDVEKCRHVKHGGLRAVKTSSVLSGSNVRERARMETKRRAENDSKRYGWAARKYERERLRNESNRD